MLAQMQYVSFKTLDFATLRVWGEQGNCVEIKSCCPTLPPLTMHRGCGVMSEDEDLRLTPLVIVNSNAADTFGVALDRGKVVFSSVAL